MNGSAGAKLLKTMLPSLDQVPMPESSASLQELLLAQLEGEDDEDENDEDEEEHAAPDDGAGVFSPVSVKQEKSAAAADGQGVPIQDAACEHFGVFVYVEVPPHVPEDIWLCVLRVCVLVYA